MKKIIILGFAAFAALASIAATPAYARHGADDPVGHDKNDDHGGHHGRNHR